jgi:hypothetical protein
MFSSAIPLEVSTAAPTESIVTSLSPALNGDKQIADQLSLDTASPEYFIGQGFGWLVILFGLLIVCPLLVFLIHRRMRAKDKSDYIHRKDSGMVPHEEEYIETAHMDTIYVIDKETKNKVKSYFVI